MNGLTPKIILRRIFLLLMGAVFIVVIEEGVSSLLAPYDWANTDLSGNPLILLGIIGGVLGGGVFLWWLFSDE